jgi:hypothetical protein
MALVFAAFALLGGSLPAAPAPLSPGQTNNPFPQPIARDADVIAVTLREFATLPDIDGVAARMMSLVEEPVGGRGGDPMNLAQNLGSAFGKVFRIDPLGKNGRGGKYGIPAANPFVKRTEALPEIFAYGIRNVQRFAWGAKDGAMYLSDIGQNIVEEVSPVSAGANLGWNIWEGSYKFVSRQAVLTEAPRADRRMTYPVVEWDQQDPVLLSGGSSASVGIIVYRSAAVPLTGRLLFGDMPSGELFHVNADALPSGGQDAIRRVLFRTAAGAAPRTFLSTIQEKNGAQGKPAATRAGLRFDADAAGRIFLLNKADGTVRVIEP